MKKLQLRWFFLLMLIILLTVSGCNPSNGDQKKKDSTSPSPDEGSPTENVSPSSGGQIIIGLFSLPEWNPLKWEENNGTYSAAERLVYRGLFTYNEKEELIGDLIEDYSIDVEGEQTLLTFTLKEGQKWHDDTPITFEDIQYTFETYLNPFYYGAWKQNLSYINGTSQYRSGKKEQISGISQNEEGKIILSLNSPTSSFFHGLTAPLLPAHQLKGKEAEEIAQLGKDGEIIGNGPYKLVEKTAEKVRIVRGIPHEQGGPYLDQITFTQVKGDYNPQGDGNGEGTLYDIVVMPPSSKELKIDGYDRLEISQNLFYYLGFNHEDTILKEKEIRLAIRLALDREGYVEKLLFGNGSVPATIIPTHSWLYDDFFTVDERNIDEARAKMAALGYSEANPLTLTFHYPGEQELIDRMVNLIADDLEEIYIQIDKQPLKQNEYYAYLFSGKQVQVFIHAWPFAKDPGLWWKLYGGYHTVENLGLNILRYKQETVDEKLKLNYYSGMDIQKAPLQQALQQMNQDIALIPLFTPVQSYLVGKGIHGVELNGDGWLKEIENWWVEQ